MTQDYTSLVDEFLKDLKKEQSTRKQAWITNIDDELEVKLHKTTLELKWHFDLQNKFKLHPVVQHMLKRHKPDDVAALVMQWPHIAESNPNRLAYTRDTAAGKADRQTLTSVGKFIKRHWSKVPDHVLRDAQTVYHPDTLEIGQGIEFLIQGVELGPRSCMQSGYKSIPFNSDDLFTLKEWVKDPDNEEPDWYDHPYSVYCESFGWKMAIRKSSEGVINGRCLILDDGTNMCYVRSYARGERDDDTSQTDHVIEAWLNDKGYEKLDCWPAGAKVEAVPMGGQFLLPYIDGSCATERALNLSSCRSFFYRDDSGEYICRNTDGSADYEPASALVECSDCEELVDEDTVFRFDNRCVCNECYRNYRTAYSRVGNSGSVVLTVRAEACSAVFSYHGSSYPSAYVVTDNVPEGYVYVENKGCYANSSAASLCTDGNYYFFDDPYIVRLAEPSGEARYAHEDDAWKDANGDWWADEVECQVLDGEAYQQSGCLYCDLSGIWYKPGTEYYDMLDGRKIAVEQVERVSSDAEWGDPDMEEVTQAKIEESKRNDFTRVERRIFDDMLYNQFSMGERFSVYRMVYENQLGFTPNYFGD